ncbi:MAG: TonB-dependent receptor [Pseudomonadota bacterium]
MTISVSEALTRGKRAPAVSGSLNAEQALARLLRGSGLIYERARGGYVISKAASQSSQLRSPTTTRAQSEAERSQATESVPIVVTGTRIERTNAQAPSPVTIVTSEEIENFGLNDATEALRFTPSLNQSRSALVSNDIFADNVIGDGLGLAALDLRGLGTARTLVLVNGRRHVAGLAGSATVDVSTIPSALIDRVEVLTGGGSSIYGADAVSGVVNFVLDEDFEGVDYRGSFNISDEGDAESYFGSVTVGGNFRDNRGNAWLNVEYSQQERLNPEQRDFFETARDPFFDPNAAARAGLGIPDEFFFGLAPLQNGFASPFGNIDLLGVGAFTATAAIEDGITEINGIPFLQVVDETGTLRSANIGEFLSTVGFLGTLPGDGIDNNFTLIPETERVVLNGRADYDVTRGLTVFLEGKYALTDSTARLRDTGALLVDTPFFLDNPFIPTALQNQIDGLAAQGITPSPLISREFGDTLLTPETNVERETFRIVGGLEGELSDNVGFELSFNYGRTATRIEERNQIFLDRLSAAVDAVVDSSTGNIVCRSDIDPTAPLPGNDFFPPVIPGFSTFSPGDGSCVPINIFGPNTVTPEAAAFVATDTVANFAIQQFVVTGTVSGNTEGLFELPGGAIGFAAGFEYRREESDFRPDNADIIQTVITAIEAPSVPVSGDFDVLEGFAEVSLPLIAAQPFAEELTLDASVRLADYTTAGFAESYAAGLIWSPVAGLRLRGSYNRAVRAPNISELFNPQNTVFSTLAFSQDPCDVDEIGNGSANRQANCASFVPDLANFDPNITPIFVTSGGNPNLEEEIADTFTIGFTTTPPLIPGLSIAVDYYNITIDNAVGGGLDVREVANFCVDADSIDNIFCDAVIRDPGTGLAQSIESILFNLASLETQGIDYELTYQFGLDGLVGSNVGQFTFNVAGTYLIDRTDFPVQGDPDTQIDRTGTFLFPENFIRVGLGWELDRWSADYNVTYRDSTLIPNRSNEQLENDPFFQFEPFTGDSFVHNIGFGYRLSEDFRVFARINDLFDRESFLLAQTTSVPSTEIGRQFQIGVQGSF